MRWFVNSIFLTIANKISLKCGKNDEIGTPLCITVDFESLDDKSVTVRDRDTMNQTRIEFEKLNDFLINTIKN